MPRNIIKILAVCIIAASTMFFLFILTKKDNSEIEQIQKLTTIKNKTEDEVSEPSAVKKSLEQVAQQHKKYIKEETTNHIKEKVNINPKEDQNVNEPNNNSSPKELRLNEDFGILEDKTVSELWDDWQIALATGDRINLVRAALIEKLRTHPDLNVLNSLKGVLQSPEIPYDEKIRVVDLLQRSATPETLEILIESAQNPTVPQKDKKTILAGIANFGRHRWKDKFHEELPPILEKEWENSSELEGSYKEAIANAIASVGSESGITMLIDTLNADKADKKTEMIIGSAFSRIKNPAAIKPLTEVFLNRTYYRNSIWEASGDALSGMGDPDATRLLLNWAQHSGPEDLIWVERWFVNVRDPRVIEVIEDSIIRDTYQNSDIYFTIKNIIDKKLE
jgi:HEAT repeat protein